MRKNAYIPLIDHPFFSSISAVMGIGSILSMLILKPSLDFNKSSSWNIVMPITRYVSSLHITQSPTDRSLSSSVAIVFCYSLYCNSFYSRILELYNNLTYRIRATYCQLAVAILVDSYQLFHIIYSEWCVFFVVYSISSRQTFSSLLSA